MAFDALRLRNVIQLLGILCAFLLHLAKKVILKLRTSVGSVFHAALVVFAAIQIHETKTALVREPNCDGTVDYVVCSILYFPNGLANSHVPLSRDVVALALYTKRWSTSSSPSRLSLRSHGLS